MRLQEFNLTRVRHAAALSFEQLRIIFGRRAGVLHETVRGVDPSPVRPAGSRPLRVTSTHDFGQDTNRIGVLEGALYRLVEVAGSRLRRMRLAAGRVRVVLDHSDGIRRPGRAVLHPASANDLTLFESARSAFLKAWTRRVRIRRLHLACTGLVYPPAQLPLFAENQRETARRENLVTAVDRIRDRFGADAVRLGRTLAA
jgi:DNA polymerase-4